MEREGTLSGNAALLCTAIEENNVEALQDLLNKGWDKNQTVGKYKGMLNPTALHIAVENNKADIVLCLLIAGHETNAVVEMGEGKGKWEGVTPLLLAIIKELTEMVMFLLVARCDLESVCSGPDIHDRESRMTVSALALAVKKKNVDIVTLLLLAGSSTEALCSMHANGNSVESTAFHLAVDHFNKDICRLLLRAGCNKDAASVTRITEDDVNVVLQFTPLHWAMVERKYEEVRFLLESGCDKEAVMTASFDSHTILSRLLHMAVEKKSKKCVEMLIEIPELDIDKASKYIQKLDHNHMTALLLAKVAGEKDIATYLQQFINPTESLYTMMQPKMPFPHKLGKYRLDAFTSFGRGAYGDVYHASIGSDGPVVVMKKISWDVENDALDFDPMREVDIARKLKDHSNIAKVLDSISQPKTIWVVMEFCELGDLEAFCKKSMPALDVRVDLMSQTTQGLLYLHSQKPAIIHRDLKLRNILVKKEGGKIVAKLSDFGCSKQINETVMGTVCGTQTFWAPECLPQAGKITYGKEVDIFALGLVYLVMIQFREGYMVFEPQMDGEANGKDTIAWTMFEAFRKGEEIPDVVKEYPLWDHELICRIKKLIIAMTRYQAKDRMPLTEVHKEIQDIDKVLNG